MNSTRQKIIRFRRNKLKKIKPQKAMWKCNLKYIKSNFIFCFHLSACFKTKINSINYIGRIEKCH